jgi:hypothetical protein
MNVTSPEDNIWGSMTELSNGTITWNGMVGQLSRREADICAGGLTITQERAQAIDYSLGLIEDTVSISMINPALTGVSTRQINLMVFLGIFTKHAWLLILVVVITISGCHAVTRLPIKDYLKLHYLTVGFCGGFYNFFLDIMQRGPSIENVEGISMKILALTSATTAYFLFSFYTGDLTASMTVGNQEISIRSLQDVLDSDYTLSVAENAVYHDLFKNSDPGSVHGKLYRSGKLQPVDYNEFKRTKPPNHLFFDSQYAVLEPEWLFQKQFDDTIIGQLAFAFQKNSEIKPLFDYSIIKLMQSGVRKELAFKWLSEYKPNDMSHRIFIEESLALGYEHLFFPTLVMLVGFLIGLALFGMELLVFTAVNFQNFTYIMMLQKEGAYCV